MDEVERRDAALVDEAVALQQGGDVAGARRLLEDVVAREPADYRKRVELDDGLGVKFWTVAEFVSAVATGQEQPSSGNLVWLVCAYPRARYLLAALAVEAGEYERAWDHISRSLALEPDHALALCEAGLIAGRRGDPDAALRCFDDALAAPNVAAYRPLALRSKAVQLIDLERLDEAEVCLREALDFDASDQRARDELEYLGRLRAGAPARQARLLHPPTTRPEPLRHLDY